MSTIDRLWFDADSQISEKRIARIVFLLRREKHVLLPEQITPLLSALEEPARTMVLVGLPTGLRIGEISGLRWKDVDFNSGEIRVEQACYRGLIGPPKTKNSRRTLPMPQSLRHALKLLSEKSASGEHLVFQTRNGTSFQRYQPAPSAFEAGRTQTWDALAQLAHPAQNSRNAIAARGSDAEREASPVGSLEDVNNPRTLHNLDSASAAQGSRKSFGFGDQW